MLDIDLQHSVDLCAPFTAATHIKDGQIIVAPIMYVALSYDHRIIDGKESVGFLVAVKEALENPEELLMSGNVERALEL